MDKSILHLENTDIYQSDNLVLSNVNLKINKGEFFYLIGKTGSGKSSLMKTLYGDLKLKVGSSKRVFSIIIGTLEVSLQLVKLKSSF